MTAGATGKIHTHTCTRTCTRTRTQSHKARATQALLGHLQGAPLCRVPAALQSEPRDRGAVRNPNTASVQSLTERVCACTRPTESSRACTRELRGQRPRVSWQTGKPGQGGAYLLAHRGELSMALSLPASTLGCPEGPWPGRQDAVLRRDFATCWLCDIRKAPLLSGEDVVRGCPGGWKMRSCPQVGKRLPQWAGPPSVSSLE